jgi:MFS family permease
MWTPPRIEQLEPVALGYRWPMEATAAVRRLATATALSRIGSGAAAIALSARVYYVTGSAVWLSATFFVTFGISGLLTPLAGSMVDRFDRRRVMIASDLASAVVWCVIIAVDAPAALLVLGFVATLVHTPFFLASGASIPVLAGEENLNRANGALGVGSSIGRIAGPPLGGLLYAWFGAEIAFAVNAISFVVSALIVMWITRPFGEQHHEEEERAGALKGLAHVWSDPATKWLLIVWVLLYLTVDVAVVADLPISNAFGWGTFGYGLIDAVIGVGALVGSIYARKISQSFEPWAVLIGVLGIAGGYLMVSLAPVFAIVLLGNLTWATLDAGDSVAGTSIFQRRSPDQIRGRVFGAIGAGALLANAVGFTFAGFLVEAFGPKGTYAICGVASLLVTPLLIPMFRALRLPIESHGQPSTRSS